MPRIDVNQIKKAKSLLAKKVVFSFGELLLLLSCSVRTGRIKLKEWGTYTSYNKNGQYYTMFTVPRFNEYGLWCYKGICFSKHGNLKNTVIHLAHESSSGLSGKQIGDMLGLSARSFLHHFRDVPGLCREKHEGVYVYYSDVPDKYMSQVQNRSRHSIIHLEGISGMDAIVILVALIKYCQISLEEIMALPMIQSRGLSRTMIKMFLDNHGLLKKIPGTER